MRTKKIKIEKRKIISLIVIVQCSLFGVQCFSQISAGNGVPFSLSLDQILRVSITNGGNIEFVFNTIEQYGNGIQNSAFYDTRVQIASSSDWQLHFGAEDDMISVDDPGPGPIFNSILKNNVGFTVEWTGGAGRCCDGAGADPVDRTGNYTNCVDDAGVPDVANGLAPFTGVAGDILFKSGTGNAGDITDNSFIIHWECGTKVLLGTTVMNPDAFLDQVPVPPAGRYVTTVFIDLEAL